MTIEVGKTYTYGGCKWLVEAKLVNPPYKAQPFIATTAGGKFFFCDEQGLSIGGRQLLPNKVKKEGWINLFSAASGHLYPGVRVYATKDEATGNGTYLQAKVEWEEEEA